MNLGIGYLLAIVVIVGSFLVLLGLFQEKHFLLKYLFFIGILFAILFIPTAIYNIPTHCDTIINSSDTNGTFTTYNYSEQCFTTTSTVPDAFYQIYAWMDFIMIAYFVLKIFYELYTNYVEGSIGKDWNRWLKK